ncbi:response regulator [soil metagenome]
MTGHKVIMIVDDDSDDRLLFSEAVEEMNSSYSCIEAKNGVDALTILNKVTKLPDFIFLDLNMPLMNGKECLIELKNKVRLKNIPVIIYSTSKYKGDLDETKILGAVYYLVKPNDIAVLPREISKALQFAGLNKVITFDSLNSDISEKY